MRFMLCARDRSSGAMTLVSDRSFPTRREAVEAVSGVRDVSALSDADVFLVDLDAAIPVAVVPYLARGEAEAAAPETDVTAQADVPDAGAADVGAPPLFADLEGPGLEEDQTAVPEVRLGFVEIDIDAWSCEDCIYISTCAKAGTLRPAECGAFQWRA